MTLGILEFFQTLKSLSTENPLWVGLVLGIGLTSLFSLTSVWFLAKRLHRLRILDQTRRELKGPVTDYIDWLHTLSGEFPQWRSDLIPLFQAHSGRDQFELNRMRRLFVDPRSSTWFARLEEYELLLTPFNSVIQMMWRFQADIGERFHRVLSQLEMQPNLALTAAEELEGLAYEQSQLASEFMEHLQYECLKSVMAKRPRSRFLLRRSRIRRTAMGSFKVIQPVAQL